MKNTIPKEHGNPSVQGACFVQSVFRSLCCGDGTGNNCGRKRCGTTKFAARWKESLMDVRLTKFHAISSQVARLKTGGLNVTSSTEA